MSQPPPVRTSRGRPKGTGAQRVFDALRDDILHLRLRPGAHIEEAALEKRFKVSRTPVREALIRLAAAGLVTLLPNRGRRSPRSTFPRCPSSSRRSTCASGWFCGWRRRAGTTTISSGSTRSTGDFAAAAKRHDVVAMSEINHDFHAAMGAACGNKYVRELYDDLLSVGLRLARSAFTTGLSEQAPERGYYDEVVGHHQDMIDAIRRQDAAPARRSAGRIPSSSAAAWCAPWRRTSPPSSISARRKPSASARGSSRP